MGLLHNPKFLLLDEPTVGIDPQARLNILEVIREVANSGTTVLYTTHYMEEAQDLCHRLAIIDHGKILTMGSLEELTRQAGEGEIVRLKGRFDKDSPLKLKAIQGIQVHSFSENSIILSVLPESPGIPHLLPKLFNSQLGIDDITIQKPSLQSVFIRITGRELRD